MKAYKLFRVLKNGDITSLFINKARRLSCDTWYEAESHPTKGFAVRPAWHCSEKPEAPHLSTRGRMWLEVEVEDFEYFDRPQS